MASFWRSNAAGAGRHGRLIRPGARKDQRLPMAEWLRVRRDMGEIGRGESRARYVLADNGSEYVIKGPVITPGHRFVAANESVAAQLAATLKVPTPDHRILEYQGQPVFGVVRLEGKQVYYDGLNEELLPQCVNAGAVYELVVFDALVHNPDRHEGNFLVRRVGQGRGRPPGLFLLAIDHARCFVPPGREPTILASFVGSRVREHVRIGYIRRAIVDSARLDEAIRLAEGLSEDRIRSVVGTLPDEWCDDEERESIADYLMQRKGGLRERFREDRDYFDNLGPGEF